MAIEIPKIEIVFVEGGTFMMGATPEQGSDVDADEKPAHKVTLDSFCIGKFPVTQRLWKAVMDDNPSFFKGDDLPVESVGWDDVQEFMYKLNAAKGMNYRLPTEAEWEYAARGGNKSQGYKYAGSNDPDLVAWHDGNSDGTTHEVGTRFPNELGIYDMSGNVREWCQDWYGDYDSTPQINPKGSSSGSRHVIRGGSWYNNAIYCRVSNRSNLNPGSRGNDLGFRLAIRINLDDEMRKIKNLLRERVMDIEMRINEIRRRILNKHKSCFND